MKRIPFVSRGIVAPVSSLVLTAIVRAQEPSVEVVYLGAAHGPHFSTSSYPIFLANRKNQMCGQIAGTYADVGGGYNASVVRTMSYKHMVATPGWESWDMQLALGTGEHGSMIHAGFYVIDNGGTFVPSNVTVRTQTYGYYFDVGYQPLGDINFTSPVTGVSATCVRMDPGTDGISGTTDDSPSEVQDASLPSAGFVFATYPVAYGPYGSGDNLEKMRNTENFMKLFRLALKYTVRGESTTGPFSFEFFVTSNEPEIPSDFRITPAGTALALSWIQAASSIVTVEESVDLKTWDEHRAIWMPNQGPVSFNIVPEEGIVKRFFRLRTR